MKSAPLPVLTTSFCVGASLIGDSALYVVLPVVFASRGLSPMQVGLILSANRWTRLFTNAPAARLLGSASVRTVFAAALLIGGICSMVYAGSTSLPILVLARCVWGACWSIIRLTGLLTVTDCVEANLAPEATVGRMTGYFSGLARLGSALGMATGGFLSDRIGFEAYFYLAGFLAALASPYALLCVFGSLPRVSVTAARQRESRLQAQAQQQRVGWGGSCGPAHLSRTQLQLCTLAFAASCAGNGLIVSTLGAVLGSKASTDPETGRLATALGGGVAIDTATFTGVLLALRWAFEGLGAPLIGELIDRLGWRRVAPWAFTLSSLNGFVAFLLLWRSEAQAPASGGYGGEGGSVSGLAGGVGSSGGEGGVLMVGVLICILLFFVLVSTADLCVKAMGVAWRETTVLVQGDDLGSAVGPVLGYALLEMRLPPSSVLVAQALVHGAAALVARAAARLSSAPPLGSRRLSELHEASDAGAECDAAAERGAAAADRDAATDHTDENRDAVSSTTASLK